MKDNVTLLFSIAIFNTQEEYVLKCIDSLVESRKITDDFEVSIVDNGSHSKELFEKLNSLYSKLDYMHIKRFEENNGKRQATEYSYKNFNSKYMFILDSDDWVNPQAVKNIIDKLKQDKPDFTIVDYRYFNNRRGKLTQKRKASKIKNGKISKHQWHFDVNTILNIEYMKNNKFNMPEAISAYEDVYINMWNLSIAKKIISINETLCFYRVKQENQLSSTKSIFGKMDKYLNTVNELIKLDYSNVNSKDNMYWILWMNIFSIKFFLSSSDLDKEVIKEKTQEIDNLVYSNETIENKQKLLFLPKVMLLNKKQILNKYIMKVVLKIRK